MELAPDRPGPAEVYVVGGGAVTALGTSWEQTRRQLRAGESGGTPETVHGAETLLARAPLPDQPSLPRYHRLSVRALEDLLESVEVLADLPLGVVASSSKGSLGSPRARSVIGLGNPGIWAGRIASCFPAPARTSSPNTACATGLTALIQAARWIQDGEVPHAVVVAAESSFHPLLLAGYTSLGVFCGPEGMRPFHPDRDGFMLGEAAAAVYLVNRELADWRNWPTRVRIRGWGETADAYHVTRSEPDGTPLRRAIEAAIRRSSRGKRDVDLLHAHLTTTPVNDSMERTILGEWPGSPVLQGIKPALGHTLGAAGLLETLATVESLATGRTFPLINTEQQYLPLPDSNSSFGTRTPRCGITWNSGFGGHNAAALLEHDE